MPRRFLLFCLHLFVLKYRVSYNSRWNSCWLSSCFFDCCVFSNNRNSKEIIKRDRKEKKKHNKIVILTKSKLNSIDTLTSQTLVYLDISHEEFKTIANEKEKYDQIKESLRNTKSKDEKYELNENIRENNDNA